MDDDAGAIGRGFFEAVLLGELLDPPRDTRDPALEWLIREASIAFLDRSIDHINEFGPGPLGVRCQLVWERARDGDRPGYVAAYLGAISLNINLLHRRFGTVAVSEDELETLFVGPTLTSLAVHRLYDLDARPFTDAGHGPDHDADFKHRMAQPAEVEFEHPNRVHHEWRDLDRHSLRLYKAGTTSAVFLAHPASAVNARGKREVVVVKCLMFPWNKSTSITRATAEYARTYGSDPQAGPLPNVIVEPYHSSGSWLIMAYQPGDTLREAMAKVRSDRDRFFFAEQVAVALCGALGRLGSGNQPHVPGSPLALQHLDLSPNNIILDPSVDPTSVKAGQVHFIDLGVNHLYTRQAGMEDHGDAVYTAPEVRARNASSLSDAYSLAVIITEILTSVPPQQGMLPEVVYERVPDIALVLEDMLEVNWLFRMARLRPSGGEVTYSEVADQLQHAFDLAKKEPWLVEGLWVRRPSRRRFLPGFSEPMKQLRRLQISRSGAPREVDVPASTAARGEAGQTYLLVVSALASLAWLFALARTGYPSFSDFVEDFPSLPSFPTGIQLIAVAQALVVLHCYQTMFSRLPVWRGRGVLDIATEIAVRTVPFIAVPTVLVSSAQDSTAWAWSCAVGAAVVSAANFGLYRMAVSASAPLKCPAEKPNVRLSSMPVGTYAVPKGFDQWWWTMLLYVVVIVVIARGLQTGDLQDTGAYVFGLLLINIGIHYTAKVSLTGVAVRGGLVRAFSANERMAVLAAREEVGRTVQLVRG